jgi:hypothetical protein
MAIWSESRVLVLETLLNGGTRGDTWRVLQVTGKLACCVFFLDAVEEGANVRRGIKSRNLQILEDY